MSDGSTNEGRFAARIRRFVNQFSDEPQLADRLFFVGFYLCIALLPPLFGLLGHKALQLPLVIISVLVCLRFLMRPACRLQLPDCGWPGLTLLAFNALFLVYATIEVFSPPYRTESLEKGLWLLLFSATLIFIWSRPRIFQRGLLIRLALAGVGVGLAVVTLKLLVLHFMGVGTVRPASLLTAVLHAHDAINDELKILAVFGLAAVVGVAGNRNRYMTLIAIAAALFVVSYFVIGFACKGANCRIIAVFSETVQFGIPLALIVLAISAFAPQRSTDAVFAVAAFILVNAPWLFQWWYRLVSAVSLPRQHELSVRAEIWDGVARKIMAAPLLGHGIESTRYGMTIEMANFHFPFDRVHHPHNMVLQLWLDLGLPAVALATAMLYFAWRFARSLPLTQQPVLMAALAMLGVHMLVTHSLWQTWNLALIALFVALVFLGKDRQQQG